MNKQNPAAQLAEKLLRMYTENNLNKITSKLIRLYRSKQYDVLRKIADSLPEHMNAIADKQNFRIGKYFTKLVILYHPDKIISYRKTISSAVLDNNVEGLTGLNHIFVTSNILNDYKLSAAESGGKSAYYYDHDFEPDPELYSDTNNIIFDLDGLKEEPGADEDDKPKFSKDHLNEMIDDFNNAELYSFIELYTKLGLTDRKKVEMNGVGMKNLNGIEDFTELEYLDLSGNRLTDITVIWYSRKIEELYLADNQIHSVTSLCNHRRLKVLDLSGNNIDDISDLFDLPNLEFVNLINNPVSAEQIEKLRIKVKIVLF